MLNSAAGVMLPSPIAPPISTISLMRGTTSGAFCIAMAMLVSGPVGQSVTVPGGSGAQHVDDRVDRMAVGERHAGLGQAGAIQPGLAVHVLGGDQLAHQRPRAAGMDRQIGPPGELEHLARVLLGQRQRHVAGDRGDREHVQLVRRAERQQDARARRPGPGRSR